MQVRSLFKNIPLLLCAAGAVVTAASLVLATARRGLESAADSPGLLAGLALFAASLALYLVRRLRRPEASLAWVSLVLLHAGLLAALAGFFLNARYGEKGFVYIREGDAASFYVDKSDKDRKLPFALRLNDFRISTYPNSLRIRSYDSDITVEDGGKKTNVKLSVNHPFSYGGYDFYQHSHGLTAGLNPRILAKAGPREAALELKFRETARVPGCGSVTVRDFIPSAVFPDSGIRDAGVKGILNPAYLVDLVTEKGAHFRRWVLPAAPESEQLGGCRLHFLDFKGVEYTVLSVSRLPFSPLILLGFALASAGCAGLALVIRRKVK
ncbi:cytochrome c biogenesis protein ResB [Mesosutterella sp. AGMB02718]|uniref:Cytochrome c biogenesis protein ResB n=1 Tax=Mesosutterella faecium TaxID=2925194 RepID=A0ABT7IR65_9BURK|nr:cytochrome c biogenesis protein ResB [Mesosutterella sp. AGMB02718]MDL2060393.1 cytochrome c biogenesis protein ResB [Mesosutterella sp. AGMB02718]